MIPSEWKKTPDNLAVEILMMRQKDDVAALIVEGPSDSRFWNRFRIGETSSIHIAYSKSAALGAVEILETKSVPGIVAVLDQDLNTLHPFIPHVSVVHYDERDLEAWLFSVCDLATLLSEFDIDCREEICDEIRASVTSAALAVGRAQAACVMACNGLAWKQHASTARWIDAQSGILKEYDMQQHLLKTANDSGRTRAMLTTAKRFGYSICVRGHDLVSALRLELYRRGTGYNIATDEVRRVLRLAVGDDEVRGSAAFRRVVAWQQRRPPKYQVV